MVVGGDILTRIIEIINNLGDPTMIVIRMTGMKTIITIIIEIIITIRNAEVIMTVTIIIVMIIREMIADSEIILAPEEAVEGLIIDHLTIGMIIMTIAAHPHHRFTMIEGSTMTINRQRNRQGMTLDGDLLNALLPIFRIVARLKIIIVIVVGVDTKEVLTIVVVITIIALLVVGVALRGREEQEDTMIGKAVIDMALAVAEEERMATVVGRMAGLDHLPSHLAIRIIGLKTL